MTIAREGLREIAAATIVCNAAAAAAVWAASVLPAFWLIAAAAWALWVMIVLFFRDPHRTVTDESGVMVAPADGRVTEVARLDGYEGIDGPAVRIGIFLSVFDVHINRMPCAGRVVKTFHRPGRFLDARHPECGALNESNTIIIEPDGRTAGPVVIRQIAGRIARRIICNVSPNERVARGQRLGLIKFGSRTELIAPVSGGLEPAVRVNDRVRGGSSVVMRTRTAAPIAESVKLAKALTEQLISKQ